MDSSAVASSKKRMIAVMASMSFWDIMTGGLTEMGSDEVLVALERRSSASGIQ